MNRARDGRAKDRKALKRKENQRKAQLIDSDHFRELVAAASTRAPIAGLTHGYYRYPARFSPSFARAVIETFTEPGDVVLDPFMGSGTTLVEAKALGRIGIGLDLNALAVFTAKAKTTVLSREDVESVRRWTHSLVKALNLRTPVNRATEWIELGYQRNLNGPRTWPIRKALEFALSRLPDLHTRRQSVFVRTLLLRTAQWALDCQEHVPNVTAFRKQLFAHLDDMLNGSQDFGKAVRRAARTSSVVTRCLHRSAIGLESDLRIRRHPRPHLILTSPPYPGVHVVYHRWQVQGRQETAAPFWIAGSRDGQPESYYTFGSRKQSDLSRYFANAAEAFTSIARVAGPRTILVQLVAFSDPSWQLQRYLAILEQVGFAEQRFLPLAHSRDGRVWRDVPNRRWYADQRGPIGASKEVVLFHRLARSR